MPKITIRSQPEISTESQTTNNPELLGYERFEKSSVGNRAKESKVQTFSGRLYAKYWLITNQVGKNRKNESFPEFKMQ